MKTEFDIHYIPGGAEHVGEREGYSKYYIPES